MSNKNNNILVRIIKNWESPNLLRQTPNCEGIWAGIQFTLSPVVECDYVIVLNFVPDATTITCSPENVWAMMQEPFLPDTFSWLVEGHDQFAKVFTPHLFTTSEKYVFSQTCLPWHINKAYDELATVSVPEKTKLISWIVSNKTDFPGHKARMKFLEMVSQCRDIQVDIFGFGIQPIEDKFDGLSPYKYSLAIENSAGPNYWTEKIADCYLAYTLPIYYGCTNIDKYFPPKSYLKIDINDFDKSLDTIHWALQEDIWAERLDSIKEARELVLNKYQLFPFIVSKIKEDVNNKTNSKKSIQLQPYLRNESRVVTVLPLLSIIVCTYNRETILPPCLQSLADQSFDNSLYEVIIVNNNSTDNTKQVAQEFTSKYLNFRLIDEFQQGLSHARNAGLKAARAKYIAYIDDDARVHINWLETAISIMKDKAPDIFGGPAYPLYSEEKPVWYKEDYGIRGDMGETGWLETGFIVGTNIFFRKSLLEEYGGFDPVLGMKGDSIGYHEETGLVLRAFEEKKKVFFSKQLIVYDLLPEYKKSLAYFIYYKYKIGCDGIKLWSPEFQDYEIYDLLKYISETMSEFDHALRKRDISVYPYPENYIVEKVIPNFVNIGMRVEYFINNYKHEPILHGNISNLMIENIINKIGIKRLVRQYIVALIKNNFIANRITLGFKRLISVWNELKR